MKYYRQIRKLSFHQTGTTQSVHSEAEPTPTIRLPFSIVGHRANNAAWALGVSALLD